MLEGQGESVEDGEEIAEKQECEKNDYEYRSVLRATVNVRPVSIDVRGRRQREVCCAVKVSFLQVFLELHQGGIILDDILDTDQHLQQSFVFLFISFSLTIK